MNSATVGTLLGVVSLAGVGLLYVKVDGLAERLEKSRAVRPPTSTAEAPPTPWETETRRRSDRGPGTASAAPGTADPELETAATDAEEDADASRPRTVEERLARLERENERLRAERRTGLPSPSFRFGSMARNLDDLTKQLELTPTQRTRVESAIESGKRQIEDILKIPDAEGRSPWERREESRRKLKEAVKKGESAPLVSLAMEGLRYRGQTIPGRSTTYGQEIDRVKKETREEIASGLSVEQGKKFEDTRIDPMLGEPGGAVHMVAFGGDDKAGAFVSESAELVVDAPTGTSSSSTGKGGDGE